jgi:uncharacterized protein (TIGR03435 family)
MLKAIFTLLLTCVLALVTPASSQAAIAAGDLPAFDAATIKPPDPAARYRLLGFYGEPGGRVIVNGNLKMLIEQAFGVQEYQISGGPSWIGSQQFDINAVPPETALSRNIKMRQAVPTAEQKLMLQSLLRDRFGFQYHLETRTGDVYLLMRGSKPLALEPPKDSTRDPRAIVLMKQGGIVDGEAVGYNTTIDYLATRLSGYLQLPVLNQTEITGLYDFSLPANDPENQDVVSAVSSVVDRLGLKLKRGRGPVETLVIDHVEAPTGN